MKNRWYWTWILAVTSLFNTLYAQHPGKPDGLTVKGVFMDYYSPFTNESMFEVDQWNVGAELGYFRSMNPFFNIGIPVRVGLVDLPDPDGVNTGFLEDQIVGSMDVVLQFHFLKADRLVSPYIFAGGGGVVDENINLNIQAPVGGGINFKLSDVVYIQLQSERRWSLTENRDNWQHSLGLLFLPGKSKNTVLSEDADGDGVADKDDECPLLAGLAVFNGCPDTDGDGLIDKKDKCPDQAGAKKLNGCPDSDQDGIADVEDKCPDLPGFIANDGCPDTDNDGIIDLDDRCPEEPGTRETDGCPDRDKDQIIDDLDDCPDVPGSVALNGCPDDDGDGIANDADKCPDRAGPASNFGCPELEEAEKERLNYAMQAVQFQSGSSVLKTSSNAILDEISALMKKYPTYQLLISGHTDSAGSSAFNQDLSERRAKACYDYLVSKGINPDRMTHEGFGESKPIADNKYPEGQEKNRRVEFKMFVK